MAVFLTQFIGAQENPGIEMNITVTIGTGAVAVAGTDIVEIGTVSRTETHIEGAGGVAVGVSAAARPGAAAQLESTAKTTAQFEPAAGAAAQPGSAALFEAAEL